jgi:hypothetical protein
VECDLSVGELVDIDEIYGVEGPPVSFEPSFDGIAFKTKMYTEELPLRTIAERKWMNKEQVCNRLTRLLLLLVLVASH